MKPTWKQIIELDKMNEWPLWMKIPLAIVFVIICLGFMAIYNPELLGIQ